MKSLLLATLVALLAAPANAQMVAPLMPSGQPALMPFTPAPLGMVPPPMVWAMGNPGFALSAFAPLPVPPGLPTFLVLGLAAGPFPVLPPLAFPGFGVAMLTNLAPIVVPAGLSGPMPGMPIPFPIPPTGGPIPLLSVHTLVLAPPSIMLTGALGITI